MIALTIVKNIAKLCMRNLVPDLMKLDHVIEPGYLSEKLVVVVLGKSFLLVLLVLDVLPHGPF